MTLPVLWLKKLYWCLVREACMALEQHKCLDVRRLYCKPVILFSKIDKAWLGYFYPKFCFLVCNKINRFSGWPIRYIRYNHNTAVYRIAYLESSTSWPVNHSNKGVFHQCGNVSDIVSADTSVWYTRQLFSIATQNNTCRVKVSHTYLMSFWRQTHWLMWGAQKPNASWWCHAQCFLFQN